MRHFYVSAYGQLGLTFKMGWMDLHLQFYPSMKYLIKKFRTTLMEDCDGIMILSITEMSEEDFNEFGKDLPRGLHLPDGSISPN